MAGRRPTPTALHVLHGNPGKRNLAERIASEPSPEVGIPKMPSYLSKEARRHWRRLAPRLAGDRILTKGDGESLAALCSLMAQLAKVEREIGREDFPLLVYKVTVDGSGQEHQEPKANPLIAMHRSLLQTFRLYAGEFGLSPSSRSRIRVAGGKGAADPEEDFLHGR